MGQPVGFKLIPGDNALPFAHPDAPILKRAGFMNKHLWVTLYHPDERYAAGNYPNQHPGGKDCLNGLKPIARSKIPMWWCGTPLVIIIFLAWKTGP
jgi:Cu2+-containing amine oxidase